MGRVLITEDPTEMQILDLQIQFKKISRGSPFNKRLSN
jgi:hypothetical protein